MESIIVSLVVAGLCNLVWLWSIDRKLRREANRLNKTIDDLAAVRANVIYKGERHAEAMTVIANRMEAIETLAKRRTRR